MNIDSRQNLSRIKHWIISYDISDNQHRRWVHNTLKDHGQRVQFSVFECELSKRQLQNLRARLSEHIDGDDSIRWYPLCHWCELNVTWAGKGQAPKCDDFHLL